MADIQYVFVDTEVFDRYQYHFDSPDLKVLKALIIERGLTLLMPRITRREVFKHVQSKSKEAQDRFREFCRKTPILKNVSLAKEFVAQFESTDIDKTLIGLLEQFLSDCVVEDVSLDNIDVDVLVDDYFDEKPPFGSGKKKNEFPDAIAAQALLDWVKQKKTSTHIVSGDSDWESLCADHDCFVYNKHLPEFLSKFPNPELCIDLRIGIDNDLVNAKSLIAAEFESLGFYGTSIEHEPDVVEDIKVDTVVVDEIFVVDAKDGSAVVELKAKITFQATVVYEDTTTGMWDSEEKRLVMMDLNRVEVQRGWEGFVRIGLFYDESHNIEIVGVSFDVGDIEVELEDDGYF